MDKNIGSGTNMMSSAIELLRIKLTDTQKQLVKAIGETKVNFQPIDLVKDLTYPDISCELKQSTHVLEKVLSRCKGLQREAVEVLQKYPNGSFDELEDLVDTAAAVARRELEADILIARIKEKSLYYSEQVEKMKMKECVVSKPPNSIDEKLAVHGWTKPNDLEEAMLLIGYMLAKMETK